MTFRSSGPVSANGEAFPIDAGTLARGFTAPPGPVCTEALARAAEQERIRKMESLLAEIEQLLHTCRNPERELADSDVEQAAQTLGVEVAALRAVMQVEAAGSGFEKHGRPQILFERHHFFRRTAGALTQLPAAVYARSPGGYREGGSPYERFGQAFGADRRAALESTSWGAFQIMGSNHRAAGFDSVEEMVRAMMKSSRAQLDAFVAFVGAHPGMRKALREKDWPEFARRYNGPNFAINRYDEKLEDAYTKFAEAAAPGGPP